MTQPAPVPATHAGHPRRWLILGVLIMALFGVSLDNTILTIALPTLARELSAGAADLQWMVDAYILTFAGLLLLSGALSDRYGRRLMLVLGLALFGIGSALAPFVGSATQLIALRAFMGIGAAFMMPSTLSIIADVFPAAERPKAIAAWGSVSAIGIVAGPLLGGWLLEHFAWPSVFLVNVPFVLLGIGLTLAVVPESRAPGRVPLDITGAALSVVGLSALVFAIIEAPSRGLDDPSVLIAGVIAAIAIVVFAWWERRIAHPMLDVRLFRDRRFSAASLSVTLVFFALMGALFFLTQYLQGVQGLGTLETGLRFVPVALGIMVASAVSAALTVRVGARIAVTLGLLVVAGGLALMGGLAVDTPGWMLAVDMFVISAGIGLAMTPATDAIMGALPAAQFGVGSAVNDTTREVGGALGIAILGSLFAGAYAASMSDIAALLPTDVAAIVTDSLAGAAAVAEAIGGVDGSRLLAVAQAAFTEAMGLTMLIGAAVSLGGAAIAWIWLPARAKASGAAVSTEQAPSTGTTRPLTGVLDAE